MGTSVRFLGIAAFEITTPAKEVILLDPCLEENPVSPVKLTDLERVDLLLVTHLAFDHLGDAPAIARRFKCPVVCDGGVAHYLKQEGVDSDQILAMPWGAQVEIGDIQVRAITSMHASMRVASDGQFLTGCPLGFIVRTEPDVRIYHSGDTAIFGDLRLIGELYNPNVGLLCCCRMAQEYLEAHGVPGYSRNEMSGDEGALAASWLGLEYALCCHYLDPEDHPDVATFVSILESRRQSSGTGPVPKVLRPGDTFLYPPEQ